MPETPTNSALASMNDAKNPPASPSTPVTPPVAPTAEPAVDPGMVVQAFNDIDAADLKRTKDINKRLLLDRLPEAQRQAAAHLLELQEAAVMIQREKQELETRKYQEQVLKVANEYTQYGVTPDMLWGLNEPTMRALGERFKTAGASAVEPSEDTPPAMSSQPGRSQGTSPATAPRPIEEYKGKGLVNLASYIEDLFIG